MAAKTQRSKRGKYENYCHHVESHFDVVTTREQFYETGIMSMICKHKNHKVSLKVTSMGNKIHAIKDLDQWCDQCNRQHRHYTQVKLFTEQIESKSGHQIDDVNWKTRKVMFHCGNCGAECSNFVHNLKRLSSSGKCVRCQNDERRLSFEDLKTMVEKQGKVLLTKCDEYRSNKQKLEMLCECGKPYSAVLSDVNRGKSCVDCKTAKFESTCMELYGVRNVSHLSEVMEKIVKSGYTRKTYILKSGREIKVQGWEPEALDYLLEEKQVDEKELVFGCEIPSIPYEDVDGKQRVYFPDFYLKSIDCLVEVKSFYTFLKDLETNYCKWKSVLNHGHRFRLILLDDHKHIHKDEEWSCVEDFNDELHNQLNGSKKYEKFYVLQTE